MLVNGRYQSVPIGNWTIEVPASFERVYFPTDILNMNKRHMVIDTERMFWRNGQAPGGMFILISIQSPSVSGGFPSYRRLKRVIFRV